MNDEPKHGSSSRRSGLRAWLDQARFYTEEVYSARYRGAIARAPRRRRSVYAAGFFRNDGVTKPRFLLHA